MVVGGVGRRWWWGERGGDGGGWRGEAMVVGGEGRRWWWVERGGDGGGWRGEPARDIVILIFISSSFLLPGTETMCTPTSETCTPVCAATGILWRSLAVPTHVSTPQNMVSYMYLSLCIHT